MSKPPNEKKPNDDTNGKKAAVAKGGEGGYNYSYEK